MTSWLYRLATAYGTRLHLWSCSNPSPPRDRQTAPPNMKVITGLSRSETISSPTRDRRDAAQVEPDASRQATQNRYPSGSGQPEARKAAAGREPLSGCSNEASSDAGGSDRVAQTPRRKPCCCHRVGWVAAHCQRAAKRQERRVQRRCVRRSRCACCDGAAAGRRWRTRWTEGRWRAKRNKSGILSRWGGTRPRQSYRTSSLELCGE